MPKYRLACEQCDTAWWKWMGMKELLPDNCPHCEIGKPYRVPTAFSLSGKEESEREIGETVEQSIIDSRAELEREKKENKSKTYDDI